MSQKTVQAHSGARPAEEPGARLIPVSLDPDPTIDAYKEGVDRSLLRENLKLTTAQRVDKMLSALAFAEDVRRSRPVPDGR